jgi:hypothetical protein
MLLQGESLLSSWKILESNPGLAFILPVGLGLVGGYAAQVGDAQVLTSYSLHTLQHSFFLNLLYVNRTALPRKNQKQSRFCPSATLACRGVYGLDVQDADSPFPFL